MSAALMLGLGATAAGIESANIVGYTTTNVVQSKWIIVGSQFTSTTNTSLPIDSLVKGNFVGVPYDDASAFLATAPQIQVQKASGAGYDSYYYLSSWWASDEAESVTTDGGSAWTDYNGVKTSSLVPVGKGFWFRDVNEACVVTIAGQVANDASLGVTATANKWNLIASPYPEVVTINGTKVSWSGIVGVPYDDASEFLTTAPQIQVQKASGAGYNSYYYLSSWWASDEAESVTTDGGSAWTDYNGVKTSDVIPAGVGFWMNPRDNAGIITITK